MSIFISPESPAVPSSMYTADPRSPALRRPVEVCVVPVLDSPYSAPVPRASPSGDNAWSGGCAVAQGADGGQQPGYLGPAGLGRGQPAAGRGQLLGPLPVGETHRPVHLAQFALNGLDPPAQRV